MTKLSEPTPDAVPGPTAARPEAPDAPGRRRESALAGAGSGSGAFGPSALVTPANALTMARVLATPLLLAMVLADGPAWPAEALWLLVVATDIADGALARRQGATRSGAFLDPLADKVFVLGAMTALVAKGRLPWPPVAVIALREVAVSLYRSYVGRQGITVPARPLAKAKTVLQDVTLGLALLPALAADGRWLVTGVLWLATAMTVVTGVQYLADGRQLLTPSR